MTDPPLSRTLTKMSLVGIETGNPTHQDPDNPLLKSELFSRKGFLARTVTSLP